ncbi:hypothetical protein AVEN_139000-1 [Araneus ventricosus]|uniref:Uncharacterized protein n=1 Tax=Araneus ventricosus TaxID=182803 RepID=A0A4Y2QGI4_ARAVE|nr:hypothetical protein AVEN_139000-1 [Araneus ventricosus]
MWMLRAKKSYSLRHRMPTYQLFAPKLTSTDIISPFTTDIRYITGSDNLVANTFSRISESNLLHFNNFRVSAEDQYSDEELQSLMDSGTRLEFKPLYFTSSEKSLICDVSTGINTHKPVSARFVWKSINKEFAPWYEKSNVRDPKLRGTQETPPGKDFPTTPASPHGEFSASTNGKSTPSQTPDQTQP